MNQENDQKTSQHSKAEPNSAEGEKAIFFTKNGKNDGRDPVSHGGADDEWVGNVDEDADQGVNDMDGGDAGQDLAPHSTVHFKKLRLTGFKSFVEPSELYIEPGLTGIVGPNGCGKSNLLEAIRWVMGENSAKSMRSGGMEDVIFAGTDQRAQRNHAEVTLQVEVTQPQPVLKNIIGDIDISRRIERGNGSQYRANGQDVRAKDIALIFADAATGAHSPALVSQGRIAAVIAAKPQQRRQMLEEAAGIAGLHVRRKDAEQKLRATEKNLERISELSGEKQQRAKQLERQAKAAERYKKLSRSISQAEAKLLFLRWREAAERAKTARDNAQQADEQVHQAQKTLAEAKQDYDTLLTQVADIRIKAENARSTAQQAGFAVERLSSERQAAREALTVLQRQDERLKTDRAREEEFAANADNLMAGHQQALDRIAAQITEAEAQKPDIQHAAHQAEQQLRDSELALARAEAEQAKAQADRRIAESEADNAVRDYDRLEAEQQKYQQQLAKLDDPEQLQLRLLQAEQARDKAVAERKNLGLAQDEWREKRKILTAAEQQCQDVAAQSALALSTMTREVQALEKDVAAAHSDGQHIIDQCQVHKGYELALAAALADDAHISILTGENDSDTGRYWTGRFDQQALKDMANAASAQRPENTESLSQYVDAPAELAMFLSHIFVANQDAGQILAKGQMLVTKSGQMRRWDGLISSGQGAGAAEKLARRTRLAELQGQLPALQQQADDDKAAHGKAEEERKNCDDIMRDVAEKLSRAESQERHILREADQAAFQLKKTMEQRQEAEEKCRLLQEELVASRKHLAGARQRRDALPDQSVHLAHIGNLQQQQENARQAQKQAASKRAELNRQLGQMREARAGVVAQMSSGKKRAEEAVKRLADLTTQQEELDAEKSILAAKLPGFDTALEEQQAAKNQAEHDAQQAADILQQAEAERADNERKLSDFNENMMAMREQRAHLMSQAEHQEEQRQSLARQCGEDHGCPPPILPEKYGLELEDGDNASDAEAQLSKYMGDRDRLGAVNLLAADELEEILEEIGQMLVEHEELSHAVSRLRGSIGALNREGRQRLLQAFHQVDAHFQRLFKQLFNGGRAQLALVDSDDPLEAGLEILAQPPGKKLASLTLLSGGEQALTAIALIFGLFLTKPSPICVLDEVDAPLDDANIERFCALLDDMAKHTDTRYLIVTHNAVTMSRMHRLFGVTMVEQGVSRLVSVDLGTARELVNE